MSALSLTTIRWKLNHRKHGTLTPKEREYLSDLVTEKLGFQAPDTDADTPIIVDAKGKENATDDPYAEVYKRSPNQGGTIKPKFIVIHDSYGSHDGTRSWILQSRSRVSYHYLIAKDGSRTQFVHDSKRAYHAGTSYWKGYSGLNGHSVGVAFWGNTYERNPSFEEIDSCAHKCVYLMRKFKLTIDAIITHQMIAPKRKNDTAPETYVKVIERVQQLLEA